MGNNFLISFFITKKYTAEVLLEPAAIINATDDTLVERITNTILKLEELYAKDGFGVFLKDVKRI